MILHKTIILMQYVSGLFYLNFPNKPIKYRCILYVFYVINRINSKCVFVIFGIHTKKYYK